MATGTKQRGEAVEAKAQQREASKADLLSKKRPRTEEVIIVLDDDTVLEHDRVLDRLVQAKENKHPADEIEALEAEVTAARSKVDAVTRRMVFRAVGSKRYDEILAEHPPENDEIRKAKADGKPKPMYHGETFPVALICESLISPKLELEEVQAIWDDWNRDETMTLFLAALSVNTRARRVADLGKGFG